MMEIKNKVSKLNKLSDEIAEQIYSECLEENIMLKDLRVRVKEKMIEDVGEPTCNETYLYIFSKVRFLLEHSEIKIVKPQAEFEALPKTSLF